MERLRSIQEFQNLRQRLTVGRDPSKPTIVISAGTCGQASGANDLIRICKRELMERGLTDRIRLRITDQPMPEETRLAGEGTLDQVRRDLAALEGLGASHVCLDTFADDIEGSRNHEAAWRMLAGLAERALDLTRETLR